MPRPVSVQSKVWTPTLKLVGTVVLVVDDDVDVDAWVLAELRSQEATAAPTTAVMTNSAATRRRRNEFRDVDRTWARRTSRPEGVTPGMLRGASWRFGSRLQN